MEKIIPKMLQNGELYVLLNLTTEYVLENGDFVTSYILADKEDRVTCNVLHISHLSLENPILFINSFYTGNIEITNYDTIENFLTSIKESIRKIQEEEFFFMMQQMGENND